MTGRQVALVEGCTHRRRHVHGTSSAYRVCACRCETCRREEARRAKRYRLRAEGVAEKASLERVRTHLQALVDAGMTTTDIARAAGVRPSSVTYYRTQAQGRWVWADRARRILSVPVPQDHAGHGYSLVPALGTQRRLRALVALGWTIGALSDRLEVERRAVGVIIRGQRTWVRSTTAAAVRDLYERTDPVPRSGASASRAQSRARSQGWVPPLAWDEDTDMDDPASRPAPRYQWERRDRSPLPRGLGRQRLGVAA